MDTQLREIERGLIDKLGAIDMATSASPRDRPAVPQVRPISRLLPWVGEVTEMVGLLVASRGPVVSIGDFCRSPHLVRPLHPLAGDRIPQRQVLSLPLEEIDGLQLGDR